jgi:hypothetical protein
LLNSGFKEAPPTKNPSTSSLRANSTQSIVVRQQNYRMK